MKRQFTRRRLFAAIAVVAIVCLALFLWRERNRMILRSLLPSPESISRITVRYSPTGAEIEEFDMPQALYEPIIDALYEASPDDSPAKWIWMASLTIMRAEEPPLGVDLYIIPQEEPAGLAYSIDGNPRRYFRGGNADALEDLIKQAYKDATR